PGRCRRGSGPTVPISGRPGCVIEQVPMPLKGRIPAHLEHIGQNEETAAPRNPFSVPPASQLGLGAFEVFLSRPVRAGAEFARQISVVIIAGTVADDIEKLVPRPVFAP